MNRKHYSLLLGCTMLVLWSPALLAQAQAGADKPPAAAATRPARVELTTQPAGADKPLTIPDPQRASLVLMLRIDQEQSRRAVQEARSALTDLPPVQVLVVVSGKPPADRLAEFAKDLPWPMAPDAEYDLIGRLNVHVWPTALVVGKDGTEIARLRGLSPAFGSDLAAYLAFATGAIDQAALQKRLAAATVVSDSAQQMARRHYQVAQRMLEKGLVEPAGQEIQRGLTLAPSDAALQVARARVLLLTGQPRQTLAVLEAVDAKQVSPGEFRTLRGAARLAVGEADAAIEDLQEALKLNPNPAEAHYFLGLAHLKRNQADQAARSFRAAFEATPAGKLLSQAQPAEKPADKPAEKKE